MINGKGLISQGAAAWPVVTKLVDNAGLAKPGRVSLLAAPAVGRAAAFNSLEASVALRARSPAAIDPARAPQPRLDLPDTPVG